MTRRLVVAVLVACVLATTGCSSTPKASTSSTSVVVVALPPVPDSAGHLVAPKPSGSKNPKKAWIIPDAAGMTDWVSADDVRFLATTRPVVPYSGPDRVVSNATLIALGEEACQEAPTYTAGLVTVSGAEAVAVHQAALPFYC